MKFRILLVAVVALGALTSSLVRAQQALSNVEIRDLLVGKKALLPSGTMAFSPDGKVETITVAGRTFRGTYSISDNNLCRDYGADGGRKCYRVTRDGQGYAIVDSANVKLSFTVAGAAVAQSTPQVPSLPGATSQAQQSAPAASLSANSQQFLGDSEIRDLLVGKKATLLENGSMEFSRDGKVVSVGKTGQTFRGTYTISDGNLCRDYGTEGGRRCYRVTRDIHGFAIAFTVDNRANSVRFTVSEAVAPTNQLNGQSSEPAISSPTNPVEEAAAAYNKQDYVTAVRLALPFADQGNGRAQYILGAAYRGLGNKESAERWLSKADEQGVTDATVELAMMLGSAWSVDDATYARVAELYRKAIAAYHPIAMFNLAVMYQKGQGVPKDYVETYKWLALAASFGNEVAKYHPPFRTGVEQACKDIASIMTREDLIRAAKLASEWEYKGATPNSVRPLMAYCAGPPKAVPAEPKGPIPSSSDVMKPFGVWLGRSTENNGFVFVGRAVLKPAAGSGLEGEIYWALEKAPDRNDKRVSKRATEYVTGYYDEQKRIVRLSGVRKDDPESLIRLSEYSLMLSADGLELASKNVDAVLQFNRER